MYHWVESSTPVWMHTNAIKIKEFKIPGWIQKWEKEISWSSDK